MVTSTHYKQEESQLVMNLREEEAKLARARRVNKGIDVVGCLLMAQNLGDVTGIIGRLGDLGNVDERYDIPASTAGGGRLNNILVDTLPHAEDAIAYLKKTEGGRATFLILEEQAELRRHLPKPRTPQNAPRIIDLIQCKPEHKVAFYHAVRDTLLAENEEKAKEISWSGNDDIKWRVVDLQGNIIERSGAMSGAGKPRSGLFTDRRVEEETHSREDVVTLESTVEECEANLEDMRLQVSQATENCTTFQKNIESLRREQRKIATTIQGLKNIQRTLENAGAQTMQAETNGEKARIPQLQTKVKNLEKSLAKAERDDQGLADEVACLQQRIRDASGDQFTSKLNQVKKIQANRKNNLKLLTQMTVALTRCTKTLKTNEKKLSRAQKELSEFEKERKERKELRTQMENEAMELTTFKDEKHDQLQQSEERFNELTKATRIAEQKLIGLVKHLLEMETEQQELNVEVARKKRAQTSLNEEWHKLKQNHENHRKEFLDDLHSEDDEEKKGGEEVVVSREEHEDVDIEMIESPPSSSHPKKIPPATDAVREIRESPESNENMGVEEDEESVTKEPTVGLEEYLSRKYVLNIAYLSCLDLGCINDKAVHRQLFNLKEKQNKSKVNMGAIKAWRAKDADYLQRVEDLNTSKEIRDSKRRQYEALKIARCALFWNGYNIIRKELKSMYRMLTMGGDAELELVDSLDPFSEGISFSVRPPKKSWKNISNISGGEKTLSSMALVFALHKYKPNPLYIMDEIDAALDFTNVSIVANYIKERTKDAQFIIISLRNNMFELANRLVGIYKTHDVSKSIAITPNDFHLPSSSNADANGNNNYNNTNNNTNNNNNNNTQPNDATPQHGNHFEASQTQTHPAMYRGCSQTLLRSSPNIAGNLCGKFNPPKRSVMRGWRSNMRAKVGQGTPLPTQSLPFGSVSRRSTRPMLYFKPALPSEFIGRVEAVLDVPKKTHLRHFESN